MTSGELKRYCGPEGDLIELETEPAPVGAGAAACFAAASEMNPR